MISAAFQSPPRARQKTRAGSVGDSDGFCRSAAQGSSASSSSRPTSNQRRNSSGVSGPARSISARASASAPIASSRSTRATSTGEAAPPPFGGSVSASSSLRNSARAAGTPWSGCAAIIAATRAASSRPQSAGERPVSAGGSRPTPSRLTVPSGVTVIVSSGPRRHASGRLGGGGVSSISMLSDSQGIALRGACGRDGQGQREREGADAGAGTGDQAPAAHFASTGSSTSRVGAGRSEKIASPTRPTTATSAR